jgi:transcriptional regulator with XRE-family HTH domain
MGLLDHREAQNKALLSQLDAEIVKQLRRGKDWTQADLAQVLKISVTKVSDFERGKALPPKTLYDWAMEQL